MIENERIKALVLDIDELKVTNKELIEENTSLKKLPEVTTDEIVALQLGNRMLNGDIEILSLELEESEKEKKQYRNEIQFLLKIIQSLNSNIFAMASILKKEK